MPSPRLLAESYRVPVIWGTVVVIAVLATVLGWLAGRGAEPPLAAPIAPVVVPGLEGLPIAEGPTPAQRIAASDDPETLIALALVVQREGTAAQREAALAAWPRTGEGALPLIGQSLIPWRAAIPPPALVAAAAAQPPPRWANRSLGDFHHLHGDLRAAISHYAAEGSAFPAADASRRRAIGLAAATGQNEQLARWAADPVWAEAFDARTRHRLAIEAEDWPQIVRTLVPARYTNLAWDLAAIALVAAGVYLFFLWHCSHGLERRRELALLCLAGLLLGAISTWPTLLLIHFQHQLGFDQGQTSFDQALHAIAGIGLREELIKLLFVLPLAPILLRRHDQLAWLLVASCVGAGFAAEENLNYYQSSAGGAVGGRFLTANFLHLALTGLVGLAALQAIRWPRQMVGHFLTTFLLVVIAHGLYDAALMVDALRALELHWAWLVIFVLCGNAYFATLAPLRRGARPDLSLTMVFSAGLALVLGTALVVLSAEVGLAAAAEALVPGTLATAVVIVMFVRGIGDRLTA